MTGQDLEARLDPRDQAQLLRDIKQFDNELFKSLRKQLRDIGKPAGIRTLDRVLPSIPSRGGLRARIQASTRISVSTTAGTKVAGVRVAFTKPRVLKEMDRRGVIPHPVFANARESRRGWRWTSQPFREGAFTESFEQNEERPARAAIEKAVKDALRTIRTGEVS